MRRPTRPRAISSLPASENSKAKNPGRRPVTSDRAGDDAATNPATGKRVTCHSSPFMRVTHVITRLVVGGAQENTIATVLGLQRKPGVDIHLISGPTSGPEGSLESVFDPTPELLTRVPELVRPVHPWKDMAALQRLT